MGSVIDLKGQRFGHLVVVQKSESKIYKNGSAAWDCVCDCGKQIVARSDKLRGGKTKSCGCLIAEMLVENRTTHGKSGSRLYHVWSSMKARCNLVTDHRYKNYGARGIKVCDEWIDDFQAFYEWAVANGYNDEAPFGQCTIDRIDNEKGYSPDNCRFVTIQEQQKNKRPMASQQSRKELELIRLIREGSDPMHSLEVAIKAVRNLPKIEGMLYDAE